MEGENEYIPPPKHDPGRPQPEKGAKKDPHTWEVVNMNNPPEKFKVVDNSQPAINVADLFESREGAQQYIDHHVWLVENPCPAGQVHNIETGECEERTESPKDENGVVYLYPVVDGSETFVPDIDEKAKGTRWEFNKQGQPGMDLGGYFKIKRETNDDEISGKLYGAKHPPGRCYTSQLDFSGNEVRLKIEHDHDHNSAGIRINGDNKLEKEDDLGLGSVKGRWIGIRWLCFNIENNSKVRIVTLVDNHYSGEGDPENNWKVIGDWVDHGQFKGDDPDEDGNDERPYTTFDLNVSPQNTIRIDEDDPEGGEGRPKDKFVFFRNIDGTQPLTSIVPPLE